MHHAAFRRRRRRRRVMHFNMNLSALTSGPLGFIISASFRMGSRLYYKNTKAVSHCLTCTAIWELAQT